MNKIILILVLFFSMGVQAQERMKFLGVSSEYNIDARKRNIKKIVNRNVNRAMKKTEWCITNNMGACAVGQKILAKTVKASFSKIQNMKCFDDARKACFEKMSDYNITKGGF